VIASDLTLGGFAGQRDGEELRRKERLLSTEGVRFVDGKLADATAIHYFTGLAEEPNPPSSQKR
jgi:hypothetical protein